MINVNIAFDLCVRIIGHITLNCIMLLYPSKIQSPSIFDLQQYYTLDVIVLIFHHLCYKISI